MPVHRTKTGYSRLLTNIQSALNNGYSAQEIFNGMQIDPVGYFESIEITAGNNPFNDFFFQDFSDWDIFNDETALGVQPWNSDTTVTLDGQERTDQIVEYIRELYIEVGFTPDTTGAASWGELFDIMNYGTPFRNLGNREDSTVKVDWYVPTSYQVGVISKICTRFPDEQGDTQGSDLFIHSDKGYNMVGASADTDALTYLETTTTPIQNTDAMDLAGYSDEYTTTSYILGSCSIMKYNESGNVYFYGVDIGREGHTHGAHWRRDVHLTGYYVMDDNSENLQQWKEHIPVSPTDQATYIVNEQETGPTSGGMLGAFEEGGSHETRVYAFHQVAELHETEFDIADKDVGDEFDLDPITGAISAPTYGVNTVKVFLDRNLDVPYGSIGEWYMSPGNIANTASSEIYKAITVDTSNNESPYVVTTDLGALAVRTEIYDCLLYTSPSPRD